MSVRIDRKRLLIGTMAVLMSVASAAPAKAFPHPPDGYCSDNVIDCRSAVMCYNGCGGVNWGQTWERWFG